MNCNCKEKIKIKYLNTYPHELKPAIEGDAGIDIYASEDIAIRAFDTVLVPTGLSIQLPKGYEAQVRPKSGLSSKGIKVDFGTVDSGYTGEIKVIMCNMSEECICSYVTESILASELADKIIAHAEGKRVTGIEQLQGELKILHKDKEISIKKGQKIAQLVINKVIDTVFIPVEVLDESGRGANGFGSTGV